MINIIKISLFFFNLSIILFNYMFYNIKDLERRNYDLSVDLLESSINLLKADFKNS